jgi:ferritin-like metal-binding protein YciE
MSREQVDAQLLRLDSDGGRISDALSELTDNSGYKLLESAPLRGTTAKRWQLASDRLAALWDNYTAYQDVVNRAREIRSRRVKPRPEDLAAIAELLNGRSITLSVKAVPLSERSLIGPSTIVDTVTLTGAVQRMNTDFQAAADVVSEVEAAWNALFELADPVQLELKELIVAVRAIEDRALGTAVAGVGDEYAALRQEVFADPLGLRAPGSTFVRRLESVRGEIAALAASVAGAADLRAGFEQRIAQLLRTVERIDEVEAAQRAAAREVAEKILTGPLPSPTALGPALRARVGALSALREKGQWTRLAEEAAALAGALDDGLAAANRIRAAIAGLMERREELRARLAAYRVRAARLGAAENQSLEAYYQTAYQLLWTRPCDLAAATRALAGYQKAVLALDGAGGSGGRK